MEIVTEFNRICVSTNHTSTFKDAIKYANEMGLILNINSSEYSVLFQKDNMLVSATSLPATKNEITRLRNDKYETQILSATSQGVNFKIRKDDEQLHKGCFDWLRTLKNSPSYIIRDVLYCQTLNTKTFQVTRYAAPPTDTICRLCKDGEEYVRNILNRCPKL